MNKGRFRARPPGSHQSKDFLTSGTHGDRVRNYFEGSSDVSFYWQYGEVDHLAELVQRLLLAS